MIDKAEGSQLRVGGVSVKVNPRAYLVEYHLTIAGGEPHPSGNSSREHVDSVLLIALLLEAWGGGPCIGGHL